MTDKDTELLQTLITRYKGYKKLAPSQELLVTIGSKESRSEDDEKKLVKLLAVEKQIAKTNKARADLNKLLNADKEKERKAVTQRKIVAGGALIAGATKGNNTAYYQGVMRKMLADGLVGDRDKAKYQAIIESLPPTQPSEQGQQTSSNGRPVR